MDVLATSSLTTPGRTINNKIISPNNLPKIDGLLLSTASSATSTDSFQETFKKTNVKMMTNAETFKTVSKGIGKSPTLPIPCRKFSKVNNFIILYYILHID